MLRSLATTVQTPRKWPGRMAMAFEHVTQRAGIDGGHKVLLNGIQHRPAGIHFFSGGNEDRIATGGGKQGDVGVERTRVFGKILSGAELGWVDENAREHPAARCVRHLPGLPNQGGVAFMQGAHGWHELREGGGRNRQPAMCETLGWCVKDFHLLLPRGAGSVEPISAPRTGFTKGSCRWG